MEPIRNTEKVKRMFVQGQPHLWTVRLDTGTQWLLVARKMVTLPPWLE